MIACLGECLIDFTPVQRNGHVAGFDLHPGGSPYNVAIAAASLGHPASFIGRVSTDLFGQILVERLLEAGVDTSLLLSGPEPSTLAFVVLDDDEPRYSFRSEGAADTLIAPGALRADDILGHEVLHIGSISLLAEPTAGSVLELVRALDGRVTVSFDPNIRPDLVCDWDAYRVLLHELAQLADIVKVSEADLESWGENPEHLLEISGPCAVVVTRGAHGSSLVSLGSVLDCPPSPCRVVDTIGAGDAFTAGLLAALGRRGALSRQALSGLDMESWRSVLEYASAAAALACERAGASPPTATDVLARLGARA